MKLVKKFVTICDSKQEGFTLVEVIVSLSILTMMLLSFNQLARVAFYSWENAQNKAIAYNLIQDTIECTHNIRDINFNTLVNRWDDNLDISYLETECYLPPEASQKFTRIMTLEPVESMVDYEQGAGMQLDDSKLKMTVNIEWRERLSSRNLQGETYFTDWRDKY